MNAVDLLPKDSPTVQAIYDWHEKRGKSEPSRGYLGASILGHHCERYLWLLFRNAASEEFPGRIYRLFERGDLEEGRFVNELRGIGCEVHDVNADGEQFELSEFGGHLSGHMDGCALGVPEAPKTWHVLEFKTHNKKSFSSLTSKGVEKSKPLHYAQMQIYMHLSGMKRALYLACNKDTDELYSERVRYNKEFCAGLMKKAADIITSSTPCDPVGSGRDCWACRFCPAQDFCYPGEDTAILPIKETSCRQCCHSTAVTEGHLAGAWMCDLGPRLDSTSQAVFPCGCTHFIVNPSLLNAKILCSGKEGPFEFIEIEVDGKTVRHGNGHGMWHARELMSCTAASVGNDFVGKAKSLLGAEALGETKTGTWDETAERVRVEDLA